jgi:hypothetical protein
MRHAVRQLSFLGVAFVLLISGCRTVWVHPNASAQMYEADILRCKYRMTPEDLQRLLADPNAPLPDYRSDWKQCMELLGWETDRRSRSSAPWGVPGK